MDTEEEMYFKKTLQCLRLERQFDQVCNSHRQKLAGFLGLRKLKKTELSTALEKIHEISGDHWQLKTSQAAYRYFSKDERSGRAHEKESSYRLFRGCASLLSTYRSVMEKHHRSLGTLVSTKVTHQSCTASSSRAKTESGGVQ